MKISKYLAVGLLSLAACSHPLTTQPDSQVTPSFHLEQPDRIPGKIVVDARDDLSHDEVLELNSEYHLSAPEFAIQAETNEEVVSLDDSLVEATLLRLQHDSRVEVAEPLTTVHLDWTPNDPQLKDQWGMAKVNAESAWDHTSGRGITVAVIDTGVACYDRNGFHKVSDLKETECVPGWNVIDNNDLAADDHGHGTHVAGTIAQSTNNGKGVAGLAYHAKIMPVKVLAAQGGGTNEGVAQGIRWAADHGAQVINMSLGGGPNSALMTKSIAYARSKGVTVVAAAGNSGGRVEYPGGSEGSIGVSATDSTDALASFSCRGPGVDLGAPGVGILQETICDGGKNNCEEYKAYSGTSMASPHVAGVAALVASMGVSNPDRVEAYMRESARVVDSSSKGKDLYGSGIVDAGAAVKHVLWHQTMYRGLFFFLATMVLGFSLKKKTSMFTNPMYLLGGLVSATGLFFLGFVLPRHEFLLDLLARPFGDWDLLLFGQHVHRWLPFATVLVPFAMTALSFGNGLARKFTAGFAVGLTAYWIALGALGDHMSPVSTALTYLWLVANVIGCQWIAKQNLLGPATKVSDLDDKAV